MSELLNGSNSASGVPFGMPNPFAFPLMSDNSNKVSEHSMMDRKPAFNVDELVKRIDAKIAQLEEEEKREKEAQSVDKFDVNDFVNDDSKDDIKNEETFTDQMYDEAALDDQFFDDFFSDE